MAGDYQLVVGGAPDLSDDGSRILWVLEQDSFGSFSLVSMDAHTTNPVPVTLLSYKQITPGAILNPLPVLDAGLAWVIETRRDEIAPRAYGVNQMHPFVVFNITTVPNAQRIVAVMPGSDVTSPVLIIQTEPDASLNTIVYAVSVSGSILWQTGSPVPAYGRFIADAASNFVYHLKDGSTGGVEAYDMSKSGYVYSAWSLGTGKQYAASGATLSSGNLMIANWTIGTQRNTVSSVDGVTGKFDWAYAPTRHPVFAAATIIATDARDRIYYGWQTQADESLTLTAIDPPASPVSGPVKAVWSGQLPFSIPLSSTIPAMALGPDQSVWFAINCTEPSQIMMAGFTV